MTIEMEILKTLYEQTCSSWYVLIDIRFKLLGFVTAVSVVVLANLPASDETAGGLSPATKIGIAVLGLVATCSFDI